MSEEDPGPGGDETLGRDGRPRFEAPRPGSPGQGPGPFSGPPAPEPAMRQCGRHPGRATAIACQRCSAPICGECMMPASVGFQCPRCVAEAAPRGWRTEPTPARRGPRGGGGPGGVLARGSLGSRGVAFGGAILIAVVGLVTWLASQVPGGPVADLVYLLPLSPAVVAQAHTWWQIVTWSLAPVPSPLSFILTPLMVWFIGSQLEGVVGRARTVVIWVTAALGGAVALFWLTPNQLSFGAWAVVLGLIAANAVFKARAGESVGGEWMLLGLLAVLNVALPVIAGADVVDSVLAIVPMLGAVAGGVAGGLVVAHRLSMRSVLVTAAIVWAALVALMIARTLVGLG